MKSRLIVAALVAALANAAAHAASPADFPFRNGDRVVFLGDSITEQRLYTTYLETYLLTRFPGWQLQFRNAGWGGDTSFLRTRGIPPKDALDRDVLSFRPTVVTIDFGMNDAGYGPFRSDLYLAHAKGEQNLVQWIRSAHATPVILTASAVEKNELGDDAVGYNSTLEQFAAGDQALAAREKIPFADQLHPFIDAVNRLRAIKPDLRLSGDTVHPGPAGHLLMADAILTGLGAPTLVSSVTIDAARGGIRTEKARVTDYQRRGRVITFRRADEALMFPIEPAARPVLQILPVADDLDRYLLQVTRLEPGPYRVSVNGQPVATFSASALAAGVNLAWYDSPLDSPGRAILQHVYAKNNAYFELWRQVQLGSLPAEQKTAKSQELTRRIEDEENAINALRRPVVFDFRIEPAPILSAPQG